MKIIVKNQKGEAVFTLDIEFGVATISPDVEMDDVANEFVRGLETAIFSNSQFVRGETVRDFLIRASGTKSSGDFSVVMGSSPGGNIEVTNPDPSKDALTKAYSEGFEIGLGTRKAKGSGSPLRIQTEEEP